MSNLRRPAACAAILAALALASAACKRPERRGEGEYCGRAPNEGWYRCKRGLTCFRRKCITHAARRAIKERELRKQSGLSPLDAGSAQGSALAHKRLAEHQSRAGAIRVRTVKARYSAWATCSAGERLVSGGCEADRIYATRPERYQQDDTVGARWFCRGQGVITAFALCLALPAEQDANTKRPADASAADAGR
ncbi:MAG: hypothetical protein KC503_09320 [Myxococcales bacterium]|nr:hypothetical protein [Myxococcales bacterium]